MDLSIIIPVYNCIDYLANCVEPLAALDGSLVKEIILVDDGSTDGSGELCDAIAAADIGAKIAVIHQQNRGVSAARNRGIKAASGGYILFVDADDTVDTEKLAELLKTVDGDASIDMAVFGIEFDYYSSGKIYRRDEMLPPVEGTKSLDECRQLLNELFLSNSLSSLCNRIIKKSIIDEADISLREDMFLYEDLEFSLNVLSNCSSVYFCRQTIYKYRQSENVGNRLKRIAHIPELLDKIEKRLPDGENGEKILLSLSLLLTREKLAVSAKEEMAAVCGNYRAWIDDKGFCPQIKQDEYALMIYNGQISKLIARRSYAKIRHSIAEWIKQNVGDFRKW